MFIYECKVDDLLHSEALHRFSVRLRANSSRFHFLRIVPFVHCFWSHFTSLKNICRSPPPTPRKSSHLALCLQRPSFGRKQTSLFPGISIISYSMNSWFYTDAVKCVFVLTLIWTFIQMKSAMQTSFLHIQKFRNETGRATSTTALFWREEIKYLSFTRTIT